jgi:hypothetical protein
MIFLVINETSERGVCVSSNHMVHLGTCQLQAGRVMFSCDLQEYRFTFCGIIATKADNPILISQFALFQKHA